MEKRNGEMEGCIGREERREGGKRKAGGRVWEEGRERVVEGGRE